MFNVFLFYGYGPIKLFITSPITISVSSVQLVKLLVAGTRWDEKTLRNGQIVSRIWGKLGEDPATPRVIFIDMLMFFFKYLLEQIIE